MGYFKQIERVCEQLVITGRIYANLVDTDELSVRYALPKELKENPPET